MNKIPLETTLAGAYRFLFTRILSIVGTLWMPFLVSVVLLAGIVWLVVPHAWLMGNFPQFGDNPTFQEIWELCRPVVMGIPLIVVLSLVMGAMMLVGLMRLSLGQRKRCYFFFSLGADVWRMVLASILLVVLIILLELVLVGVFFGAMAAAKAFLPHNAVVLTLVVLGIVEVCFYIYAIVRWPFFLPAVVVAEKKIGLGRSWQLGGGNFWRIVVVYLLIFIPVAIVAGVVWQMTVMPVFISEAMRMPDKPAPADFVVLLQALLPLLPVILGLSLLQKLATMGLMAGAIGTAYNALNPPAAPAAAELAVSAGPEEEQASA